MFVKLLFLDHVQPYAVWYHDDNGAHHDAQECESIFSKIEVVNLGEHDRECFEPCKKQGVDKSQVGVRDKKNRLAETELERPVETGRHHVLDLHILSCQISLALEVGVARQLSESLCSLVEDGVGTGLWEREDEQDQAEPGKPDELPNCPSPGLMLCCKASYQRSKDGSTDGGDAPDTDCVCDLLSRPDVRQ